MTKAERKLADKINVLAEAFDKHDTRGLKGAAKGVSCAIGDLRGADQNPEDIRLSPEFFSALSETVRTMLFFAGVSEFLTLCKMKRSL